MSFEALLVHVVTVFRAASTEDPWGNTEKRWDTAVPTSMRAWIAQTSSTEVVGEGREAQVSEWRMSYGAGDVVRPGDRVTWEGITFEVDGTPQPAWTQRGIHHHEVPLRVVTG